jgi:hypothetical protein
MKQRRSTGPYEHMRPITREHEAAEQAFRARERNKHAHIPDIDFDHPPPFPGKDPITAPTADKELPTGVYQRASRSVHASHATEGREQPDKEFLKQAIDLKYRILGQRSAHERASPKDADEAYAEDLQEIEDIKNGLANEVPPEEWLHRLTALQKKYQSPSRYRDAG